MQATAPDQMYTLEGLEGDRREQPTGAALMADAVLFAHLPEEDSRLLTISCAYRFVQAAAYGLAILILYVA